MSLACAECPVRDRAACSALTVEERSELARLGRIRTLERGDILFAAGEVSEACATLISGALKISRTRADGSENILALVHPAGFVGELFQPFAHYDVVALSNSRLCLFAGSVFENALERFPALARALLRRTQEDLYSSRELLALTSGASASERVAGALMEFARAASDSPCHPSPCFDLPVSRRELAELLGLTIETVSRTLTRLEQDGMIQRSGSRGIEVLDSARLGLHSDDQYG